MVGQEDTKNNQQSITGTKFNYNGQIKRISLWK